MIHKITFTLKQHTPIIHFQPDQDGATLRASEVKPRFDRYFLTKLGAGNYASGVKVAKTKGWLIKGAESPSLNYKMIIKGSEKLQLNIIDPPQPFFGNMDADENVKMKKIMICRDIFSVDIVSSETLVLELQFKNAFIEFVNRNNFGTRNKKGFGSYTVDFVKGTDDSTPIKINLLESIERDFYYYFDIPDTLGIGKIKLGFDYIDLFGKIIRGGYNINGLYLKPVIFYYAKHKGWQWDKKSIKEEFLSNNKTFSPSKFKGDMNGPLGYKSPKLISNNYPSIRNVLGLATDQKWDNSYFLKTKEVNGEISRYASPLLFKPVFINGSKVRVYFNWVEQEEGIWGKTFENYFTQNENHKLKLTVPSKNEFAPQEFLEFISHFQHREHMDFRIDKRYLKKMMEKDSKLGESDKSTLTNWCNSDYNNYINIETDNKLLGTNGYSIYEAVKGSFPNGLQFKNEDLVNKLFNRLNPYRQMNILDSIFNQLNSKFIKK